MFLTFALYVAMVYPCLEYEARFMYEDYLLTNMPKSKRGVVACVKKLPNAPCPPLSIPTRNVSGLVLISIQLLVHGLHPIVSSRAASAVPTHV